jgi:hypothetical protein
MIGYFVFNTVLTYNDKNCDQENFFRIWGIRKRIDSQDQFIWTGKGQNYFWNRVLAFFMIAIACK